MPLDTAPADVDEEDNESDNESDDDIHSASIGTIAKDALGEWKLWLGAAAALAVAGHAFRYNQNMPNGYVPFFTVFAGLMVAYAYHDMQTTADIDVTH